jgi:hypothetical protein
MTSLTIAISKALEKFKERLTCQVVSEMKKKEDTKKEKRTKISFIVDDNVKIYHQQLILDFSSIINDINKKSLGNTIKRSTDEQKIIMLQRMKHFKTNKYLSFMLKYTDTVFDLLEEYEDDRIEFVEKKVLTIFSTPIKKLIRSNEVQEKYKKISKFDPFKSELLEAEKQYKQYELSAENIENQNIFGVTPKKLLSFKIDCSEQLVLEDLYLFYNSFMRSDFEPLIELVLSHHFSKENKVKVKRILSFSVRPPREIFTLFNTDSSYDGPWLRVQTIGDSRLWLPANRVKSNDDVASIKRIVEEFVKNFFIVPQENDNFVSIGDEKESMLLPRHILEIEEFFELKKFQI